MKLNYIDFQETPVSIMFTAGDIKAMDQFLSSTETQIKDFYLSGSMTEIAKVFSEIRIKLDEGKVS
jgi:predicted butyrate kinase (DUF1464 family)